MSDQTNETVESIAKRTIAWLTDALETDDCIRNELKRLDAGEFAEIAEEQQLEPHETPEHYRAGILDALHGHNGFAQIVARAVDDMQKIKNGEFVPPWA